MDILHTSRFGNRFYSRHDDWYWEKFWEYVSTYDGVFKLAYEAVEEEFKKEFGIYRFTSYESFRVGKHRRLCGGKVKITIRNQMSLFGQEE